MTRNVGDIISKLPAGVMIIPGHGPLSDVDGLKAFHRMLVETTDIVRKRMAAGKTLEQIKAEGLPKSGRHGAPVISNRISGLSCSITASRQSRPNKGLIWPRINADNMDLKNPRLRPQF